MKNLELISSVGTIVYKSEENLTSLIIDTKFLNPGLYILKIETSDSKVIYEKIIIQH